MPQRLTVQGPGEFIRMHLLEVPDRRDYIGATFRAYKAHQRAGGVRHVSCRGSFGSVIWMLHQTKAIAFDGAELVSFDGPPGTLPPDMQVASPSPRHYYRIADPEHPAFFSPMAVWRAQRGLPMAAPRVAKPKVARVAKAPEVLEVVAVFPADEETEAVTAPVIEAEAPEAPTRRRRQTVVERLVAEGRPFRDRIEQLRLDPDPEALEQLERDQLDWFDRVLDAAERATGDDLKVLVALGERLEAAAHGFGTARTALTAHQQAVAVDQPAIAGLRMTEYLAALETIEGCCP